MDSSGQPLHDVTSDDVGVGDRAGGEPPGEGGAAEEPPPIVVYWRPGCGFCMSLRARLRRRGVPTVDVNIWDDADGAAFVRAHAGGNETVPTVAVGDSVLVNPSSVDVLDAGRAAGVRFPEPPPPWWRRRRNRTARHGSTA
ncbi:MAG: hypothetical protein JJU45_06345 [Acidimicrobiia bacterium]|nr:hypothetical protein [Acidimicrobiia bacterium]